MYKAIGSLVVTIINIVMITLGIIYITEGVEKYFSKN